MFARLFRRDDEGRRIATALYGVIVAQARTPAFYADLGVPDTVRGRFEMVALHTILIVDRLKTGSEHDAAIGQKVFDAFCADMDRSLRELGIGDMSVPKRMRQVGESFYGRAKAYGAAFADDDVAALTAAIDRNVFGEPGNRPAARALAAYAAAAHAALADDGALRDATLTFPDPSAYVATAVAS